MAKPEEKSKTAAKESSTKTRPRWTDIRTTTFSTWKSELDLETGSVYIRGRLS